MRSGCSSQDFALRRNQFLVFFRVFSPCQRRKSREKTLKKREKRQKICAASEENQSFMPYSAGLSDRQENYDRYLSARRSRLKRRRSCLRRVRKDRTRRVLREEVENKDRTKAVVSSRQC